MKIYTAMPVSYYGGAKEAALFNFLRSEGFEVRSPNTPADQDGYKQNGMAHFEGVVRQCDALCFFRFADGSVGAGVAKEIAAALDADVPVYDASGVNLHRMRGMPDSVLSVDDTRAKIKCPYEPVVKIGDTIVVWFSCGAASAVAWHETVRIYGQHCNVIAANNPVAEEDGDNLRFAADVEAWIGQRLVRHANPEFPSGSAVEVWEKRKAMSFPKGAPCTIELKKIARRDFEENNRLDWHVLGFTAEERDRYVRFALGERSNTLPVLIDARLQKQDCIDILLRSNISPPRVYGEGYPNANCIGCVKATSPTYWNLVRRTRPEVFKARAEQSRRLGVRLVRVAGERIFLDELDPDAEGAPLKAMSFECGIFCDT